jgi:CheY-like chemotaxis protein
MAALCAPALEPTLKAPFIGPFRSAPTIAHGLPDLFWPRPARLAAVAVLRRWAGWPAAPRRRRPRTRPRGGAGRPGAAAAHAVLASWSASTPARCWRSSWSATTAAGSTRSSCCSPGGRLLKLEARCPHRRVLQAPRARAAQPARPLRAARAMRLLLVEDEPTLRAQLRAGLAAAGYAVDEADNGRDATAPGRHRGLRRRGARPRPAGARRPERAQALARCGAHACRC